MQLKYSQTKDPILYYLIQKNVFRGIFDKQKAAKGKLSIRVSGIDFDELKQTINFLRKNKRKIIIIDGD